MFNNARLDPLKMTFYRQLRRDLPFFADQMRINEIR